MAGKRHHPVGELGGEQHLAAHPKAIIAVEELPGKADKIRREGGTRIGEALKAFNFQWARRVLGRGAVVLMSCGWGRSVAPLVAPYGASKWGWGGMARALAEEVA